jgi:hypothetical protein
MTNATKTLQKEARLRKAYDTARRLEPTLHQELWATEKCCLHLLLSDYAESKGLYLPERA